MWKTKKRGKSFPYNLERERIFYCTVPSGRKNTPHHISYTVSRFVNAITDLRIDLFLISLILFVKIIGNNIMNK